MKHFAGQAEMDSHRVRRLESLAYEHGAYFDSYVNTEPNREYLWSSDDRAVVGFVRAGRYLHVAGGVLGAVGDRRRMLQEIVEFARLNRVTVSFFHIGNADIPLFRSLAFQVTKFGLESRLPLAQHTWQGKDYAWVRRQASYVSRQSVAFEEWKHRDMEPGEWGARFAELQDVSRDFLAGKTQKEEVPFFEGQLLRDHLHRRRMFVARADEGRGRVEGFVICNPMQGGKQWAIEMYRQRDDAVRGTIPYLFHQTIEQLKAEGTEEVSICPVPAVGCERRMPGENSAVRLALKIWLRFGYALFDVRGIYHFKSRFRPQFQDMFICAYPRSNLGAVLAYTRVVGAYKFKVGALLKKLFSWTPQRRTLARPEHVPQPANVAVGAPTGHAPKPAFRSQQGLARSAE